MSNEPVDKNAPPVEPLYDTWGGWKDAAAWCLSPDFDFKPLSVDEVNNWFADVVTKTLDMFSHLARVWQVSFNTISNDDVEPVTLEWEMGKPYDEFIGEVLKSMREYPGPISFLEMKADLFAYVRTRESPDKPVRAWVRLLTGFSIWGGPESKGPYLCLEIDHSLFGPQSRDDTDNSELYALNQPLLENALRRWEEILGPIKDIEGTTALYEYGFRPKPEQDTEDTFDLTED